MACERGLAFGTELIFTYGPYGCLLTGQYWPATYSASLALYGLSGALSIGLIFERTREWRTRSAGLLSVFWLGLTPETAVLALPMCYVVHGYFLQRRTLLSCLALSALPFLALTKFMLLPLSAAAVVTAALMRERRFRLIGIVIDLALFFLGLAAAWRAAHQPLGGFVHFLVNATEVARGYPQAMSWPAAWSTTGLLAFGLSVTVTVIAGAMAGLLFAQLSRYDERQPVPLAWALVAGWGLVVLRHGTTRADLRHLLIPVACIGAGALLVLRDARRHGPWLRIGVIGCGVLTIALAEARYQGKGGGILTAHIRSTVHGLALVAQGHDPRAALDAELTRVRERLEAEHAPLSMVRGRYDVLGSDQYLILALGTDQWTPRPVLQSYSAYTRRLTRLDADFIASDQAPPWLVTQVQTIDSRLPMMDDPATWPTLARHYAIEARAGARLVLRRTAWPRDDASPVRAVHVDGADWLAVPALGPETLHAAIEIEETFTDRMRTIAWKPPIRLLELRCAGSADVRRFRLVPEAAAAGFVLSPLILTSDQFEDWLRGVPQPGQAVTSLRVVDERGIPIPAHVTIRTTPFYVPRI
ncbi:MAG: hypothetical protein U0807_18320 [Candidatus Binatia bacterium]